MPHFQIRPARETGMTVGELRKVLSKFEDGHTVYLCDNLTVWEVDRTRKGRAYPANEISILLFSGEMAKASNGNLVMLYEEEIQ